jgi:hypothetical protein
LFIRFTLVWSFTSDNWPSVGYKIPVLGGTHHVILNMSYIAAGDKKRMRALRQIHLARMPRGVGEREFRKGACKRPNEPFRTCTGARQVMNTHNHKVSVATRRMVADPWCRCCGTCVSIEFCHAYNLQHTNIHLPPHVPFRCHFHYHHQPMKPGRVSLGAWS